MTKKIIFLMFTGFIVFMPLRVLATEVCGVINFDTTWNLSNSPYSLSSTLQISEDATLTIEPGVIVNGNNYYIEVWGALKAIGNSSVNIFFNQTSIQQGQKINSTNPFLIDLEFCVIDGGYLLYSGSTRHSGGQILLKNSIIKNTNGSYMYIINPEKNCYFEKNIFINSAGIYTRGQTANFYIRNNVFYNWSSEFAIQNSQSSEEKYTIVEYNSFLDKNKIALKITTTWPSAHLTATNNYWGSTNLTTINSMIYDRNDDLACPSYIDYLPILTEPHKDTPSFDYNDPPIANAGSDQIVFNEIDLDGSQSHDSDGQIILYQWKLQHRKDSGYNKLAEGVSPTISGLQRGFYNVTLTVTDDEGKTGTDDMLLAVYSNEANNDECPECPECVQDFTQTDLDAKYQEGCDACSNGTALSAIISPELNIHIPALQYETLLGTMDLWANFEFAGESNGDILWKLSDFGEK